MAFWGDYHTHTTYSRRGKKLHAVGSVAENAAQAARVGLKELAITDHGYTHYFGVQGGQAFAELKAECRNAEKSGVKLYAGFENNLNPDSGVDMSVSPLYDAPSGEVGDVEIVQAGFHAMVVKPSLFVNLCIWARNVIFKFLPGRKKLIAKNTAAYKRMIDEYPIDFIGHLNRGILADAVEVAKYAHERGVYIELNGRHKSLSIKQVRQMAAAGVEFICGSDAHRPSDVGKFTLAVKMIEKCKIPYEQIANWERLPSFRSKNFIEARTRSRQTENND